MDRCNFKRNVKGGAYQICEEHEFEWVVKPRNLKWKGKQFTHLFNLYMPVGDGVNHTNCLRTKSDSHGLALDRLNRKRLEELNAKIGKCTNAPLSMESKDDVPHDQ